MDRRTFLKSSGAATIGGLATTSVAGTAVAANARILSVSMAPASSALDTALTARRLSEGLEATTGLQLVEAASSAEADVFLAPATDHIRQHPAWETLTPIVHGMSSNDFSGWLVTGGGAPLLEQLEAEAGQRIFVVGHQHAPYGLWADRELLGLHSRPSLTIASSSTPLVSASAPGSGNIELVLSDGLPQDLELQRLDSHVLHALPVPLAGVPLILTVTEGAWQSLSTTERAILKALATEEYAANLSEGHVANRVARTALPLPAPLPLPAEFRLALASAVESNRERLANASPLATDILASMGGYRAITGGTDIGAAGRKFTT